MSTNKGTIAKRVLLNELADQTHIVLVEHVIFWALEQYAALHKSAPTEGSLVAQYTVNLILKEEAKAN